MEKEGVEPAAYQEADHDRNTEVKFNDAMFWTIIRQNDAKSCLRLITDFTGFGIIKSDEIVTRERWTYHA